MSDGFIAGKILDGSNVAIALYYEEAISTYFVTYHIDGVLWNWIDYKDEQDAKAAYRDPMAACRPKPVKVGPVEVDRSYIELMMKRNTGRRISRKPGAA